MKLLTAIKARMDAGSLPNTAAKLYLHEVDEGQALPYAVAFFLGGSASSSSMTRSEPETIQISAYATSATEARAILDAVTDWLEDANGFDAVAPSLMVVLGPNGFRQFRDDNAFHALCEVTAVFDRQRP